MSSADILSRDVSKTTRSELWGWYFYAWACEPFIVSAVGTYVPLLLEQLARENGFTVDDKSIPCALPRDRDPLIPPPDGSPHNNQCVVSFLGMWIDTSSLALYTFSLSVLVQTLVVVSMSGAADRGRFRKRLLIGFACAGALAAMCFIFVGKRYYFASLLAVISNAAFGAVSVCGNAYLPVLVNNSDFGGHQERSREHTPLLEQEDDLLAASSARTSERNNSKKASLAAKISGSGVAFGYLAAFFVQVLTMIVIKVTGSTSFSLQLATFIVGVWWLVFQLPVAALLKPRPGPPLPLSDRHKAASEGHVVRVVYDYVRYGWRTLFATFKEARQMKDVAIFLLGWFILSDAATTINSAAILFARSELEMTTPALAIIGILVVASGMTGAITIPRYIIPRLGKLVASVFGDHAATPVVGIMFVILIAAIIPLYGLLGFYFNVIGLNHPWEMFILAAWYGFALGGLNTLCRSIFSILIPSGKETTFFSLFAVTDKGSSIIGPFITGFITDRTHNIRYTFYFLFVMMVLPLFVFYWLDVERGREEALALENVEASED